MLRTLVFTIVSLGCLPASALDYVRIAAMNIEHLGGRTPGQRPIALAEHFMLAAPDILVLEEIHDNDEEAAIRTNEELNTAFSMMNETSEQDWKYELFSNKNANDKQQLCGVAWDAKRVTKVGATLKIAIQREDDFPNSWFRHPHAAKFSCGEGKTDIVVIPVHMKANQLRGDNDPNIDQRAHEANLLVDQLDPIRENFKDNDIVLLGDTNILQADEDAMRVFLEAGFRDLNDSDSPTYVGDDAPFDRILVPTGTSAKEFVFSRQYILTSADPEAHKQFLSDHQMVMAVVKVTDDDDENE